MMERCLQVELIRLYTRTPGMKMIYDWSNPNKGTLPGPGSGLVGGRPRGQAKPLSAKDLPHRPTHTPAVAASSLPGCRVSGRRPSSNLKPEIVAAIILQSSSTSPSVRMQPTSWVPLLEKRRTASIGLGQVTVATAEHEGLFANCWLGHACVSGDVKRLYCGPGRPHAGI